MFASGNEGKQEKQVRQLQSQEQSVNHIPYFLSGLLRAHFFQTIFLEKAVDVRCIKETVVERQKCEPVGNPAFYAQLYLTISQLFPSTEITNLSVGCPEFQINCRLLLSEKTDGQYIV